MARRYAPLLCSIWDDADFQALSEGAQRCYVMLLSQRKLSMVGVLPYTPRSWSRGCAHTSTARIEEEIDELRLARFVVIDQVTDELLIRTMVKHDSPRGPKSVTAMWRALDAVDSPRLRREVLHHIPQSVWSEPSVAVPAWVRDALSDGASARGSVDNSGEPVKNANDQQDAPSDAPSEGGPDGARAYARAASGHLPPATEPPAPCQSPPRRPTGSAGRSANGGTTTKDPRIETVYSILADTQIARHGSVTPIAPDRYRGAVLSNIARDHGQTIAEFLAANPDHPAQLVADRFATEIA